MKHRSRFVNGALVLEQAGKPEAGFIAQELHEVLPTAAHRPEDESKGIWTVSYEQVIPYTVKAVQELKTENDRLKATNEAQKARIDTLERQMHRPPFSWTTRRGNSWNRDAQDVSRCGAVGGEENLSGFPRQPCCC